jgi:hypothetical protein
MNLTEAWSDLRDALEPLGIEVGREVLAIWKDREQHKDQPLLAGALRELAMVIERLLEESKDMICEKATTGYSYPS